jgi:hypothetical protein
MLVDVTGLMEGASGILCSAWDGACSLFDGSSGSSNTATTDPTAYSQHSYQTEVEDTGTREVTSRNGNRVVQKHSYPEYDHVLIYPQGSIANFIGQFKGMNLGKGVAALINGICTPLEKNIERAKKMMEARKEYVSVFILHNATKNGLVDALEAYGNALGLGLEVGKILLEEFSEVLDSCLSNGISFKIDFIAHSQGAAILYNILKSPEFSDSGSYKKFMGRTFTFGGARIISSGINFVDIRDFVPWLCVFNYPYLISGLVEYMVTGTNSGCVHFVNSHASSSLKAHAFEGDGYRGAFEQMLQAS